ncbi:hypothetical protein [Mycolicibacterium fluoranthenivorans]|uniref:Integral membrane protein n=1 Tax=Mycolicibacterium fluoranthenivorans TaxID=258505 RepID=A0A7X5U5A4_9MYCO|nr:hypothetical protein [Mycolicibacterium fluoranthenivorans]MCV7354720.1 hypothetical protein [Mycolicibacterium fluoranthenivorans]NIH98690.1 hypothetical protein [Mycolicibacterium fluoranthenivorans]
MTTFTAPTTRARDGLVRFAMRLDAVLVGIAGIPFVAAADWLSSLTGVPVAVEYGLGVFFLGYGVVVYWLAGRDRVRPGAIATITANALFTVGFVGLAEAGIWPLTTWGYALLFGGALYTAVIGSVQYAGLRRI